MIVRRLNRPHRQERDDAHDVRPAGPTAWEEVTANDDIRCVILTGAEGDFSSGMDLRALARRRRARTPSDTKARGWPRIPASDRGCARPTADQTGHRRGEALAIAIGTEILQGTDIRVAVESARFGVSEARWSLYDGR